MSVEAITIALHHSRAKGAARTILIGIANHDGDGGAWPSMATLAKYANISRRGAQKAVQELIDLREIEVSVQGGGNAATEDWRRPNLYRFKLTCPHDCDRTKNHRTNRDVSVLPASYPQGANHSSPGEPQDTRGANHSSPKTPSNHLTKDSISTNERNRAREIENCPTTGQRHRLNRKLGYCADCFTSIALCLAPNRKEGAE